MTKKHKFRIGDIFYDKEEKMYGFVVKRNTMVVYRGENSTTGEKIFGKVNFYDLAWIFYNETTTHSESFLIENDRIVLIKKGKEKEE